MALPDAVTIRELGPREGFQTLSQTVPTTDKVRLIDALSQTGVQEIEIASFVRADRVPQMADAEETVAGYACAESVRYHGLYLNQKGFERAEATGRLDNRAWLNTAASETFLKKNSNTTTSDLLEAVPAWVDLFRKYEKEPHGLLVSMAFGCPYEGDVTSAQVIAVVEQFVESFDNQGASLKEISLADTVGLGNPESVRRAVGEMSARFPDIATSLHLHDTRGTGIANAYAGLLEGVRIFEASVGGLGGCPFATGAAGNVCTEDLVYLLSESGVSTGIDLDLYVRAASLAEEIIGHPLPGKYYRIKATSS